MSMKLGRLNQFLPGTRRGTMRSMVERAGNLERRCVRMPTPSVSAARCHLPASGEDWIVVMPGTSPLSG